MDRMLEGRRLRGSESQGPAMVEDGGLWTVDGRQKAEG